MNKENCALKLVDEIILLISFFFCQKCLSMNIYRRSDGRNTHVFGGAVTNLKLNVPCTNVPLPKIIPRAL